MQLSIVSYLEDSATKKVRELQQTMSDVTGSKASLSSWLPHVTLGDGVELSKVELEKLIDAIQDIGQSTPTFSVTISGYGSLDSRPIGIGEVSTPYVIFIDVTPGKELLELVGKIKRVTSMYPTWYHMPEPYLPHVTLAFRDLGERGYRDGLEYLKDKNIQFSSKIDHIALVEKLLNSDVELTRIKLAL